MSTSKLRATALVVGLFGAGLAAGAAVGEQAAERSLDPYASVDTLVRIMALIEATWVDDIDTDTLVQGAIEGMIAKLDTHSVWLGVERWRDVQRETQGAFTGIGVDVKLTDQGARVVRVLPGSPAQRDGVLVGDLILTVDGKPLVAADLHDAQSALLGPRGTPATLQIQRPGDAGTQTVQTERDQVDAPALQVGWLPKDVVYLHLSRFQQGSAQEVEAALARLASDGPIAGVVLDLRDNPGGLLSEAVALADLFLPGGTIVSTWGRIEAERRTYPASPDALDAPMVVLVNGLSASAAEIVAASLQDTGRAVLLGTRTYGKGTVQTVFEHRDGSALKLTVARYFTPSGQPVAPRDGRQPDIEVPWPAMEGPSARLKAALAHVTLSDADRAELNALVDALPPTEVRLVRSPIPWDDPLDARLMTDPQLAAAYVHVSGGH